MVKQGLNRNKMTLFAKCNCGRGIACDGLGGIRCNNFSIAPITKEFTFEYEDINFKVLRKLKGKTLKQLEIETGISNPYLSQLENGKIESPSFKTVTTLLKYYGFEIKLIATSK